MLLKNMKKRKVPKCGLEIEMNGGRFFMQVVIHAMNREEFQKIYEKLKNEAIRKVIGKRKEKNENWIKNKEKEIIIYNNSNIRNCTGCFCCWIKNPGRCILKDGYENLAELYSKAEKIIIISKCCYGTYSPFVKNVLDRSIPYLLPFFKLKNNEMHHTIRYKKKLFLEVYFYGKDLTELEKNIAEKTVKANCINLNVKKFNVSFLENIL